MARSYLMAKLLTILKQYHSNPIRLDRRLFARPVVVIRRVCVAMRNVHPDISPHCLRHTYATDLARNKIPIDVAKTFLGHSSITMTADIYNHFGDADDASEYVDSI